MSKAKIAIVTLVHYIYFQQFDGLRDELMKKSEDLKRYMDDGKCEVIDAGYVDCVDEAFEAVQKLKKEDPDMLFILLSTYVPSAVCAPFPKYLDISQIHHLALGTGHHIDTLRKLSRISGIRLIEVK
ncbi:MAG: hypothetical protein J6L85_01830 [Clostridia bacterium]|nr:hypothetical protein [Clostridia bacterium]